jgi:hypothetical protein
MSYLDPKEQVIDLKLTSYGKYLLSIGKLNPVFYAFYDDDVVYDANYVGVSTETQSEIEPRIQEETPRFSTQTVYSGRELEIFSKNPNIINDLIIGGEFTSDDDVLETAANTGLVKVQDQPEKTEILQNPIGSFNPVDGYSPGWNVSFLKAPLSSSSDYYALTKPRGTKYINIPQLETEIKYKVLKNSLSFNMEAAKAKLESEEDMDSKPTEDLVLSSLDFDDGSSIEVVEDFLALRIEESNTFLERENFEIEVFEVLEKDGIEQLVPMKFYVDRQQYLKDSTDNNVDPDSVESYFNFLIDRAIDSTIMCPLITEDKKRQLYLTEIFNCEKTTAKGALVDIYGDDDDTKDICN